MLASDAVFQAFPSCPMCLSEDLVISPSHAQDQRTPIDVRCGNCEARWRITEDENRLLGDPPRSYLNATLIDEGRNPRQLDYEFPDESIPLEVWGAVRDTPVYHCPTCKAQLAITHMKLRVGGTSMALTMLLGVQTQFLEDTMNVEIRSCPECRKMDFYLREQGIEGEGFTGF